MTSSSIGPVTIQTTSAHYHVRLREDLSRAEARAYWAGPHADIVRRLPHVAEYRQHHFSATDHGYWPATSAVDTATSHSRRLDGFAELTFRSVPRALLVPLHTREVMRDEQNFLSWDVGHLAGPGCGRWAADEHDETLGHRTAVLLRRRAGSSHRDFRRFVHETLAPALVDAGAREVRSYAFLPGMPHPTPGVAHDNPPQCRFHGAALFGTSDRDEVAALLSTDAIGHVIDRQHLTCSAIHAYTCEQTIPVISHRKEQDQVTVLRQHRHRPGDQGPPPLRDPRDGRQFPA